MEYIERKSLLYKSGVEYADYTINHVQGCAHGCLYPCYAFMLAKRFGKVKDMQEWRQPKLVKNSIELLKKEIPKYKNKIKSVHLCFTTDPFMYGYEEISQKSIEIINLLNEYGISCTALTKGILPKELAYTKNINIYGISLISLNENFRKEYEPYSAPYLERINNLKHLHEKGFKTWVSIEPYPTPNIINQHIDDILNKISFVDKIIFGRLNYNRKVHEYKEYQKFYNEMSEKIINYCLKNNKEFHIKDGTYVTEKCL
ncbi:Radical SAM domain protein [Caldicellulosiruptor hydrothermalis 108]|uniref:Radical SAM domain protein n=1 Tax=Caldicellulosiruptor hydrothermalis (strain DSM 18901 / VKM B-2411 / 108) TaxID=632292 RepID=E4QDP9_CALH1|nr:radical SAM protein [Caldicellulosiruptor hydrothermalis]ADQ06466.1 Radical SAM domain protein [Caldicellulosiruptor hydrothermalis 108]